MTLATPATLAAIRALAATAGERIMAVYATDFGVETKADESPLTAADRAAHAVIAAGLAALTPDVPVWSEEGRDVPWAERRDWTRFWLVDPLDGTREFIRRNGEFTVNIALCEAGQPVLGVVLAPALGREYFGHRGGGAFRVDTGAGTGGAPQPIAVRSIAAQTVRVAGSRSHRGDSLDGFLRGVGPHELVAIGSSLKFGLVAEGAADVYPRLGPTSAWDTAAGQAVLEAAGGRVTDLAGQPLRYNQGDGVLNPHFLAVGPRDRDWLHLLGH
jgi:3'(2'), 5'-bisphosphate nucleotidase